MHFLLKRVHGNEIDVCVHENSTLKIGKDNSNDLQLLNPYISSQHAIMGFENGKIYIKDLMSTNGTFKNDAHMKSNVKISMEVDDTIEFARLAMTCSTNVTLEDRFIYQIKECTGFVPPLNTPKHVYVSTYLHKSACFEMLKNNLNPNQLIEIAKVFPGSSSYKTRCQRSQKMIEDANEPNNNIIQTKEIEKENKALKEMLKKEENNNKLAKEQILVKKEQEMKELERKQLEKEAIKKTAEKLVLREKDLQIKQLKKHKSDVALQSKQMETKLKCEKLKKDALQMRLNLQLEQTKRMEKNIKKFKEKLATMSSDKERVLNKNTESEQKAAQLGQKAAQLERDYKRIQTQFQLLRDTTGVSNSILLELSSNLNCSICMDLFKKATVLNCSHTFCNACIMRWIEIKGYSRCPVCRQRITSLNSSLDIDKTVSAFREKLINV